jgi:uncharacterized protein DUF6629
MCFSATASFVSAGIIGAVGLAALSRTQTPREWPLAAVPLVFAAQQGVEGLLWLQLPVAPDGATATALTYLYLLFAEVLWPVYAPIACLLIEPSSRRRLAMSVCLIVGAAVSFYYLQTILAAPHAARIVGHHVTYITEHDVSHLMGTLYVVATGGVIALSSHRAMMTLAAVVIAGAYVSYMLYWDSFISVWCFFAAAASVIILFQFERSHRRRLHALSP